MDGVEKLVQMNEVERMREVMDVISDNMRKQNDKDRMEMLAMLASTTTMEANLMSVKFAQRAKTVNAGNSSTKQKGKALMKGVEQAENDKGKSKGDAKPVTLSAQPPAQQNQQQSQQQQPNQPQQAPANTLATRTQQALDKKRRLAGRGILSAVRAFRTV
jgi:Tfp pilus assembly protein FimT